MKKFKVIWTINGGAIRGECEVNAENKNKALSARFYSLLNTFTINQISISATELK